MGSPRREMQRLIDRFAEGRLQLNELITRRYPLTGVAQGYEDMHAGLNVRGVIDFSL
jgi:S-(hydroxymethyl)glutathione dehydrogenase/alcohol dehydrogenase